MAGDNTTPLILRKTFSRMPMRRRSAIRTPIQQASPRRAKPELGNTDRNIEAGLAGHGNWLQRDADIGPADEHVGPESDGKGSLARSPGITARERARAGPGGRHEHAPKHALGGSCPNVDAEFADRADVELLRPRYIRREQAGDR